MQTPSQTYADYVAYCERLGIPPMTETQWNLSQ
jgi:hypothetical protein